MQIDQGQQMIKHQVGNQRIVPNMLQHLNNREQTLRLLQLLSNPHADHRVQIALVFVENIHTLFMNLFVRHARVCYPEQSPRPLKERQLETRPQLCT